jgi:large subunit ribosomal protein L24e
MKCVFCGKDESLHKGMSVIFNDGSVNYYCSSKCRKNSLRLGRDRRRIKWTEAYRLKMQKEAGAKAREAKA